MTDWQELEEHSRENCDHTIEGMFESDDTRAGQFSISFDGLLFDYSKTTLDNNALQLFLNVMQKRGFDAQRVAMFQGDHINRTEDRAVLHVALRNLDGGPIKVDGRDVMPGVRSTLARMELFADHVRAEQRYSDVVNIGIGGSDLGPAMATRALALWHDGPNTHFVSNVDPSHINDVLAGLDPARTLVIVASKTFTTTETLTNATTARKWLQNALGDKAGKHFVALSTARDKTTAFGVPPNQVFGFEDWVGGRYSLWGPIGLSLMLAIGPDVFREFLRGGQAMDQHFLNAPARQNMPVMLALTGLWHARIKGYATRAILPYDQRLSLLPSYLQQLEMESNGKAVAMDGAPLKGRSGPVVWGAAGTNGQHAFYQLIHQSPDIVPCEFMVAALAHDRTQQPAHDLLVANCLAQSEALMRGRNIDDVRTYMAAQGYTGEAVQRQAAHRVFSGNRPSTTLIYEKMTPYNLGRIIALYEHRVFVEGVLLGINSFDQWGVELGKELAVSMLPLIESATATAGKDGSTLMLLKYIKEFG